MKKKMLLIVCICLMGSVLFTGCQTGQAKEATTEDIYTNPSAAEFRQVDGIEGIIENDPEIQDGSGIVNVTTSDGNRLALVLEGESLNYQAGDKIKISGEVTGQTQDENGKNIPLIDGATITPAN